MTFPFNYFTDTVFNSNITDKELYKRFKTTYIAN